MLRMDMPEVLAIERSSFEFPWRVDDLIRCLRQRNCNGMVAELDEQVVGFMIYFLARSHYQVLSLAVRDEYRRFGVGTQMAEWLIRKLSARRRSWVELNIRETNLRGQLFFRSMGFKAVAILRDHFEGWATEDAYVMEFKLLP